jgi:hypothetical protein
MEATRRDVRCLARDAFDSRFVDESYGELDMLCLEGSVVVPEIVVVLRNSDLVYDR